jgi:RimJ/RimL family protein N-acetyltransferase
MKPAVEPFGDDAIMLRLVENRDIERILDWRNNDDVRIWFKTSDKVSLKNHRAWFEKYLAKTDDFFFIVEAAGTPVGQCALYNIDASGSAEIGRFISDPDHAGKGYIARSCLQLVKFGRDNLKLRHLYVDLLENNERAAGLYRRCGFAEERRADGIIRVGLNLER